MSLQEIYAHRTDLYRHSFIEHVRYFELCDTKIKKLKTEVYHLPTLNYMSSVIKFRW